MRIYSVYLPPEEDVAARLEKAVFVKEGFSWPALFFSGLWCVFHGLWIVLIIYASAMFFSVWLFQAMNISAQITPFIHAGITLLFAFEANGLRERAMLRRGYELHSQIQGSEFLEAEARFYNNWFAERQETDQAGERSLCESPS